MRAEGPRTRFDEIYVVGDLTNESNINPEFNWQLVHICITNKGIYMNNSYDTYKWTKCKVEHQSV